MFPFIVFDFSFRLTTNQGNFNLKKKPAEKVTKTLATAKT